MSKSLTRALNAWMFGFAGGGQSEWQLQQDGFSFAPADWTMATMERKERLGDAILHYDEAIRRQVICRLSGHGEEAACWKDIAEALNNAFELKRNTDGSSTEETSPGT